MVYVPGAGVTPGSGGGGSAVWGPAYGPTDSAWALVNVRLISQLYKPCVPASRPRLRNTGSAKNGLFFRFSRYAATALGERVRPLRLTCCPETPRSVNQTRSGRAFEISSIRRTGPF